MTTNNDSIDEILIELASKGIYARSQAGHGVDSRGFLEEAVSHAKAAIQSEIDRLVLEAQIDERQHAWGLINDIRYDKTTLQKAHKILLNRLSEAQVDQQLASEAQLKTPIKESKE